MAADSGVWCGGVWMPCKSKLLRLRDGSIAGLAGWKPEIVAAIGWYEAGADPERRPPPPSEPSDVDILILKPDHSLWNLVNNFRLYETEWPFAAAGSHLDFVYGALCTGFSAKATVELAVRHCSHARPPVHTMVMD